MYRKQNDILVRESKKRNGLQFYLVYKCSACNSEIRISSEPHAERDDINKALVWGASAVGLGNAQCEELLSIMDIPFMSNVKYRKIEVELGNVSIYIYTFYI
jgi:hypothetical protein